MINLSGSYLKPLSCARASATSKFALELLPEFLRTLLIAQPFQEMVGAVDGVFGCDVLHGIGYQLLNLVIRVLAQFDERFLEFPHADDFPLAQHFARADLYELDRKGVRWRESWANKIPGCRFACLHRCGNTSSECFLFETHIPPPLP